MSRKKNNKNPNYNKPVPVIPKTTAPSKETQRTTQLAVTKKLDKYDDWDKNYNNYGTVGSAYGSSGGYYGGGGKGYTKCYHEPLPSDKPVWEHKGRRFHLGGKTATVYDWDMILDLNNNVSSTKKYVLSEVPEGLNLDNLNKYSKNASPTIKFIWPDFATLPVHPPFWEELFNSLPQGDILIFCGEGHGRTGAAIICLMLANQDKYVAADDLILQVKDSYCKKIIETEGQEKMIQEVEDYYWE